MRYRSIRPRNMEQNELIERTKADMLQVINEYKAGNITEEYALEELETFQHYIEDNYDYNLITEASYGILVNALRKHQKYLEKKMEISAKK